jgi:8-oxo-dGTP pyrophosphatase MutT (NUDIX family)
MKHLQKWQIINSSIVFDHKWYKLRRDEIRLPNGAMIDDYFVSVRAEVAIVFPVTSAGEVIMVRQYKHGAQEILLEFPGGVFNSDREPAEEAAMRELQEETGYTSQNITRLSTVFDNPTKDTNRIHFFLAQQVEKLYDQHLDSTEDIVIEKVNLEEIPSKIIHGEICVAGSIAISFLALQHLQKLQSNNTYHVKGIGRQVCWRYIKS